MRNYGMLGEQRTVYNRLPITGYRIPITGERRTENGEQLRAGYARTRFI